MRQPGPETRAGLPEDSFKTPSGQLKECGELLTFLH